MERLRGEGISSQSYLSSTWQVVRREAKDKRLCAMWRNVAIWTTNNQEPNLRKRLDKGLCQSQVIVPADREDMLKLYSLILSPACTVFSSMDRSLFCWTSRPLLEPYLCDPRSRIM